MSLDLVRVAEQLPLLLAQLDTERATRGARLRAALARLTQEAARPERWAQRLADCRCRWPLALPLHEDAARGYAAPPPPEAYSVLAVDGSHIDVDRHAPARCFVLNLGWAAIHYGCDLPPELDSAAEVQPSSQPLTEQDSEDASHEDTIRGETLALLRSVRELHQLAQLAAALPGGHPRAALLDGNLGLWNVTQAPISRRLRERLIYDSGGLLPALNTLRDLAGAGLLVTAAYTSAPGTADVVHSLRVAACPLPEVVCTRCPGLSAPPRPCDVVGLTADADLFTELLAPGERSAVFLTRSRAFLRSDTAAAAPWYEQEGHAVAFFYLRLPEELARVEMPVWQAGRPEHVALLHTLLLDQCAKGPGYPIALQEAHEQAVITTVDRRSFAALLDREVRPSPGPGGTAKSRSKATRRI